MLLVEEESSQEKQMATGHYPIIYSAKKKALKIGPFREMVYSNLVCLFLTFSAFTVPEGDSYEQAGDSGRLG